MSLLEAFYAAQLARIQRTLRQPYVQTFTTTRTAETFRRVPAHRVSYSPRPSRNEQQRTRPDAAAQMRALSPIDVRD